MRKPLFPFFIFLLFITAARIPASTFSDAVDKSRFGPKTALRKNVIDTINTNLQLTLDLASPGDTVILKPGLYIGNFVINTNRVTIDGKGRATVSGGGEGSVFTLNCDSSTIKNLYIIDSGSSHDQINAGVTIKEGNSNRVENCRIEECLFGVDIFKANGNLIINNEISSKSSRQLALKGDAIRLWYSEYNRIRNNYWHDVRDMVVWYSAENLFEGNLGIGNRYSIHFMYAHNNRIQGNEFYDNSVGVFLMYSEKTIMTDNKIFRSIGPSGMCLGLKETSSNRIMNNQFIYSSIGIYFDRSPFEEFKTNSIENNEIAFCTIAMQFHSDLSGNVLMHNFFHNNISNVNVRGNSARKNKWRGNFWDDYEGFDRNKDNIGDTPYRLYIFVEHLWTTNRYAKFFYGSPILAIIDFLEKLAPFSQPKFILEDKEPIYLYRLSDFQQNQ
jgi:nitrous oxidase accessory protein